MPLVGVPGACPLANPDDLVFDPGHDLANAMLKRTGAHM